MRVYGLGLARSTAFEATIWNPVDENKTIMNLYREISSMNEWK